MHGDIEYLQSAKIDLAPIHDIDGSGLWRDQIQRQRIAHFAVGNVDKTGIGPRRSSNVCILTAAFALLKSAQGNRERHKSIVVLSRA